MHTQSSLNAGQTYILGPGAVVYSEDGARRNITENTGILVHSVSDSTYPSWARVSIGTELALVHPNDIEDLPVPEAVTEVKVGDTVHLKAVGVYSRLGEYTNRRLYPEDNLVVRRVTAYKLLVRKDDSASFWIDRDRLVQSADEQVKVESETGPAEGDIAIDDPRIAWIWKKAARLADDLDFCEEYDNIATRLGVPPRARERSVLVRFPDVEGTSSEPAWVTVLAITDDEAIDKAKALLRSESNTYTVEVD
jgi:hypothetical protein